MWFLLVFLCAFSRTANPLIERRLLGHTHQKFDVDSVLKSPEDVESLVDLQESGVGFDDSGDSEIGDSYSIEDDQNEDAFNFEEDPDNIVGTDQLLEGEEERSVKDAVGQPPEVLAKYGHGKYDGVNLPGKLHDGERPQEDVEEKGTPKASDESESDDKSETSQTVVQPSVTLRQSEGISPQMLAAAILQHTIASSDSEEGRGEPESHVLEFRRSHVNSDSEDDKNVISAPKLVHMSSNSDKGAANVLKSQESHSNEETSPKIAELVKKGHTLDASNKNYKILKPLKIPYSQLPEHIRPPNWMKGYKLVPKEKPTEKPEYNKLNFETPVTTHPATPNRIVDIDARNPAFYTRPPTASPPPRPVVHTVLHTYKVEPSDTLRDLLEHPPKIKIPEVPKPTEKPHALVPKKFLKYLQSMAKGRQSMFAEALSRSNKKSRKLFAALVKKIVKVSETGMNDGKAKYSELAETIEKLEDNMDKRFDEFKKEQKVKYTGKLSKAQQKMKAMSEQQADLKKQFRDAIVDVKQEVSDDLARARKSHKQEANAGRLERAHLLTELKALKQKKAKRPKAENEAELLGKLNALRQRKGKKPLTEAPPPQTPPQLPAIPHLQLHVINSNGHPHPYLHAPRYRCSSCRTNQCHSACNRCNSCQTDRCRNVCRCGRVYRRNLRKLKHEVQRMKKTWNRKHRLHQRRLIRVLRDKLKRFRLRFQKALLHLEHKKQDKIKKPPPKKVVKSKDGHFRTLLFGSWAKRSHRRLYRILEKPHIRTKTKRKVVRVFHKYYHKAMREASRWQDTDKHLMKYLSTVTRIWMKKARWILGNARKKKPKKKKKKVTTTQKPKPLPKPVKIRKPEPLPPKPPVPQLSEAERPYAERLYMAWRARSEQFIDVHYASIPEKHRAEVMGYVHRVFKLVRKKYMDYLAREYAPGSRYARRKRFLDWLVKVSEAVHKYVMRAILGDKKYTTGVKRGYLNRIWMKWYKKSKAFARKGMRKIHCKGKARDYISDIFNDAKQSKRNHEAMGSTKSTKMKFLRYLVKTSKQLRAKVAFFQKTCKPVKGPRPYLTKMYKRWKRLSSEFVAKNAKRLCKDRYRDKIRDFWKQQKREAEDKYLRFLNKEVSKMNAAESAQVAVSEDEGDEVAVGSDDGTSIEAQLGVEENWFIKHLKKETRSLEAFVRAYLRRCGYTIIPRRKRTNHNIARIRRKYMRKMQKTNKGPPETMISKDHTYGITLGFGNRNNANNIGIGVENMHKDRSGDLQFTPWDFNRDSDFKRSSYNVGLSLDDGSDE